MICPVEIGRRGDKCPLWGKVELFVRGRHEAIPGLRGGAGHEDTGGDLASDGEKDQLGAGSGDHRDHAAADAAGAAQSAAGGGEDGGAGVGALSAAVF